MKNIFLALLTIGMVSMIACKSDDDAHMHEDDGAYDATVTIVSPADGDMAVVDTDMDIKIDFNRPEDKTIHHVKVEVLDADGNVLETLLEEHAHQAGSYSFDGTYKPTEHGEYTLRATTSNDAKEEEVKVERSFTAMHPTYDVTIVISKPTDGATVAVGTPMDVVVNMTHDDGATIHHVKIEVLDANGDVVETLDSGHKHVEGSYIFDETGIFTPATAGTYTLKATTLNHNMSIMPSVAVSFTAQ